MTTQTIKLTFPILDLLELAPKESSPARREGEEAQRSHYKGEAELAQELSVPFLPGAIVQYPAEIDPDEFEAAYQWFLA